MYAQNVSAGADLISTGKKIIASKTTGANSEYAKLLRKTLARATGGDPTQISTVKRFKPDGSIQITTYEDGDIISQTKIKPHLVPTPDFSAPPKPDGSPQIKFEQRFNLLELLMI